MAAKLNIGIDRITINPPLGTYLIGYANRKGGADSVHSDLTATTLILSTDLKEYYAVVSLDMLGLNCEVVTRIKEKICKLTKIPSKNIRLCCTHTHSAPIGWAHSAISSKDKLHELINKLKLAFIEPIKTKGISSNKKYIDNLVVNISKSAKNALMSLSQVDVMFGKTEADFNINRRNTVCDFSSNRETDKSINIVQFVKQDNVVMATLINYACHNVGFGPKSNSISSDIAGVMRNNVENEIGGLCIFIQGATGDLNPVDLEWSDNNTPEVNELGHVIAKAILSKLPNLEKIEINNISSSTAKVNGYLDVPEQLKGFPIKNIPKIMINKLEKAPKCFINSLLAIRYPWKTKLLKDENGYYTPIDIGVLKIGKILMVSVSMEPFTETCKKVKEKNNFLMTIFAGYTDGLTGYLPPKGEYKSGGYEVELVPYLYRLPGTFREDTEGKVVDKIVELINRPEKSGFM